MKFSTREDIEAPIADVFAALSEFESFERSAIRRGAEVRRIDKMRQPGAGMTWKTAFDLRGKRRKMKIEMMEFDPPNLMRFQSTSPSMTGHMSIDLMSLSPRRTRVSIGVEMKPETLAARLLVQSLKLAKSNLTKRFKKRVADYARDIEDRLVRSA